MLSRPHFPQSSVSSLAFQSLRRVTEKLFPSLLQKQQSWTGGSRCARLELSWPWFWQGLVEAPAGSGKAAGKGRVVGLVHIGRCWWASLTGRNHRPEKSYEAEPWEISRYSLEITSPPVVPDLKRQREQTFHKICGNPRTWAFFLRCLCSSLIFSIFFLYLKPCFPMSFGLLVPSTGLWKIGAELRGGIFPPRYKTLHPPPLVGW